MYICWEGGTCAGLRGKIVTMFYFPRPGSRRRRASLLISILIPCGVVYLWLHRAPVFVKPSSASWGQHAQRENVTYFLAPPEPKSATKKAPLRFQAKPVLATENPASSNQSTRAGTEYGSLGQRVSSVTEARPALP